MPQPNGTIYTFGRDVNILWRHGILQVSHVTWILTPDWSREVTWLEYWPLIGPMSSHFSSSDVFPGSSWPAERGGQSLHHRLGLGPANWALIGQYWSRDLNTGLSLNNIGFLTLKSDSPCLPFIYHPAPSLRYWHHIMQIQWYYFVKYDYTIEMLDI